ncbi:MAG: hypothetical protein WKF75_06550 [Singulisphaera sp.]
MTKADATGAEVYDHTELTDQPTDAFAQYDRRNGLVGIAFPTFLDGRKMSQGGDVDRRVELAKFIADPPMTTSAGVRQPDWVHPGQGFVNWPTTSSRQPASHPNCSTLAADFKTAATTPKI